jgi:DNA-binding IclR family transcriptional regulator
MHVERLINLLEVIAAVGRPVATPEIIDASGLPKPTCYRLMQTLQEQGLVNDPNDDGRFVIGDRLIRIALQGKADSDICRWVRPLLKAETLTLNETVFLARRRAAKVEIILVETPSDSTRSFIHPGLGERPLHACSCSKAIAALAEGPLREKILNGKLRRFTGKTKTTRKALLAEFEQIRQRGFADCDEEIDTGIASVAAPVSIDPVGATFSVGAVAPVRRFGSEYRIKIGEQLKTLANRIGGAIKVCESTAA